MRHRVNRTEFLQTLARVMPGVSAKNFLEQSSCFAFTGGWAVSFNDEICCRAKTGLPPEFEGAVHAAPLVKLLETMSDDEVELEAAKTELVVRGARKRAGVRLQAEIVMPVDGVTQPKAWTPLPEDFGHAVEQVAGAAGSNNDEFLTVCVHVHPNFVEACDRMQATRYEIETGVAEPFLVRAKSIAHVAKLELTKVGETDSWVHFRNKHLVFSCRRHAETFFETAPLLAVDGAPATLPRGALEAAVAGQVFTESDKANNKLLVSLSAGKMVVRGDGAYGWFAGSMDMVYRGPDVSFRIAPQMLAKLVKEATECTIGNGKLWVVGERWTFVTVLGRPEPEKGEPAPAAEVAEEPEPEETDE